MDVIRSVLYLPCPNGFALFDIGKFHFDLGK